MLSKKFLAFFLVLVFYIGIIAYSDFNEFSINISKFQFEYLPIILGLTFGAMLVKGLRQQLLLKKCGIIIPLKDSLLLYLAGLSMIVTPGGSGELIKSYYLKKKFSHNIEKSFPIVFVERFFDLVALITIISVTLIFIKNFEVALIIVLVLSILILAYIAVRSKTFFEKMIKIIERIPKVNKFSENLRNSYDTFYLLTSKKSTGQNWIISVIAWSFDVVAVYLVFTAFQVNLDIIFTTFVMFSSLLFGVLTLLPAGIGLTEISVIGFLTNEGISLSLATSIMVMIRLVTIWYATIIGFITTKLFLSE